VSRRRASGARAPGADASLAPAWRDGWLEDIRHVASPNADARPPDAVVTLAIVHSISLPPGQYGGDAVEQLFTNRLDFDAHPYYQRIRGLAVSAHFLVRRDGEVLQFVSCDARAWHAGRSVWRGREACNDYSIGIELEGLEGETFEAAQYASLAGLLAACAARYPLDAVAGHEHVAPERKRDPGPGFDWSRLAAELRGPAGRLRDAIQVLSR